MLKSVLANLSSKLKILKRNNKKAIWTFMGALLFVPTIIYFLYLAVFASPMYISSSFFAIRSPQMPMTEISFMTSFFRGGATATDTHIIVQYVHSMDMIQKLDKKLHVIDHYSSNKYDYFSRLPKNASMYEVQEYWASVVSVANNVDTGIISISVRAYTPEMAQQIGQSILEACEDLINSLNIRSHKDSLILATQELDNAETRLRAARKSLQDFRERNTLFDPESSAKGTYEIIIRLESELTQAKAALAEVLSYMRKDAPQANTLKMRITALEEQIAEENARLTAENTMNDSALSAVIAEYQNLRFEEGFAEKFVQSALTTLETTRIQALSKSIYLMPFEEPTLPDDALYPNVFRQTFLFFLALALILAFTSLIIAAIREHAGF